jgi:hypothetical protein
MKYRYNNDCSCPRCQAHGYTGPAILITIGVLFLLDQIGRAGWMHFHYTWPAILIVIGVIKLLEYGASMEGHIQRQYRYPQPQPVPPGAQGYAGYPPQPPVVTPAPAHPAGFLTPVPPPANPEDQGGHNG